MIHLAILLPSLSGFILLLLAMARHQQEWLHRKLSPAWGCALRLSGLAALTFAFIVAGMGLGWACGVVTCFGWLTMAAALVVAANVNRDRILRAVRP